MFQFLSNTHWSDTNEEKLRSFGSKRNKISWQNKSMVENVDIKIFNGKWFHQLFLEAKIHFNSE